MWLIVLLRIALSLCRLLPYILLPIAFVVLPNALSPVACVAYCPTPIMYCLLPSCPIVLLPHCLLLITLLAYFLLPYYHVGCYPITLLPIGLLLACCPIVYCQVP